MKLKNVGDVAAWRLCIGCGSCVFGCPGGNIQLVDIINDGLRPIISPERCSHCGTCLQYCPGAFTVLENNNDTDKRWGPLIEVWEGFAADSEIRFKGSSGGLCTTLSLFCLDKGFAEGILHIGADQEKPWKNKTYLSQRKEEVVLRSGSRYSPASPCDGLAAMKKAKKPSVFIGKPCDVCGLRLAQRNNTELSQKTSLAIGFFCAGTPSTLGTLELLRQQNIEPETIAEIRYRGMGWPGNATVRRKDESEPGLKLSYNDSWGFVQKYRPFRCYLCPDLTAEFADISVGDPWYREVGENEPGQSLILIRTQKGKEIFHEAVSAGYVKASKVSSDIIFRSQKNLLGKRQAIWGRLLAMKLLGIPCPQLKGFHLFENWLDLAAKEKAKSILGTVKRIIRRNYFKPWDIRDIL